MKTFNSLYFLLLAKPPRLYVGEKEVRIMEDKLKELKTYVASEPFHISYKEDMTIEYYVAFAYPILFVRKTAERRDGSIVKLNIHLYELVEYDKEFVKKFIKAIPKLFMEIAEGTAVEEDYDLTMIQFSLVVNELGGIGGLKFEHVLKFLRLDP